MGSFLLCSIPLTICAFWAGIYGIKFGKPLTGLLAMGLWFQGVLAPVMLDSSIKFSPSLSEKAAICFTVGVVVFVMSSWYIKILLPKRMLIESLQNELVISKKYKRLALLFTVFSWAVLFCQIFLLGGFANLWTRKALEIQIKSAGFLDLCSSFTLLYPIVLLQFYLGTKRNEQAGITKTVIFIPMMLLIISFFMGTTTKTILCLSSLAYPVFMTLRNRPVKFIVQRVLFVGLILFLAIGVLRFGRFLGYVLLVQNKDLSYATENIFKSDLSLTNSFMEYQIFSGAVEGVDGGGPTLGLKSYELALLQFVPSSFWPEKIDFINEARPDLFYRDHYGRMLPASPSTFLGEGYLADGMIGLVLAALFLGFVVGVTELILRNCSFLSIGTTVGSLFTSAILIQARMDISSGFLFVAAAVVWMVAVKLTVGNRANEKRST